jgi:quercetin dioxygenase-like cupin family protein
MLSPSFMILCSRQENHAGKQEEDIIMEVLDLKKLIKFSPDRISREMLSDKPEMRVALMCLNPGQKLEPHKAPLRLMMYCVQGKGTFTVGDEKIEADEKTCILCEPSVPHGFEANKGEKLVVMAVVTPVD